MGALFGLVGALAIGLSDIFGRRIVAASTPLTAAVTLQAFGALVSAATMVVIPSEWISADVILAAVSGIGMGVGLTGYYTGLSRSTSTVVAPLVAILSTVVPFGYVQLTGDSVSGIGLVAAGVAVVGLVLVTVGADEVSGLWAGIRWGLLSGMGYGTGLAVLTDVSEASGAWPAVGQRASAFVFLAAIILARRLPLAPPPGTRIGAAMAGLLGAVTTLALVLGVQVDASGTVIALSMFPAFSVLIGRVFFGDPIRRLQAIGIAVALGGTAGVVAS